MTGYRTTFLATSAVGAAYFSLLLLIVLFVRDAPGQPAIYSTINSFMGPPNVYGYGDPLSFATGAIDLYSTGWFRNENLYVIRLWPPGFMFLEAALLRLFGAEAPIFLVIGVLSASLLTAVLLITRYYLRLSVGLLSATVVPILLFVVPLPRLFLLEPIGLVFGEVFSIGFFLMGLVLIAIAGRSQSKLASIAAGLSLGCSAYFRSQYELLANVLTLFALVWLLVALFRYVRGNSPDRRKVITGATLAALAVMTAQLTMLPWRLFNVLDPNVRSLAWVQTQALEYRNNSMTSDQLYKDKAHWIVHGGGNLGCRIDVRYCGRTDAVSFYRSFTDNFVEWYRLKIPLWRDYWFSSTLNFSGIGNPQSITDLAANLLFLICLLGVWPLLWLSRRSPECSVFVWFNGALHTAFFVLLTLVHLETRYLFLLKIQSLFMMILLVAPLVKKYRTRRSDVLIQKPV